MGLGKFSFAVSFVLAMTLNAEANPTRRDCSNFAKFGAIRAYHGEMGTVQGSSGIETTARLVGSRGNVSDYAVSIFDSNEDGESWEASYRVRVEQSQSRRGSTCRVLQTIKVGVR